MSFIFAPISAMAFTFIALNARSAAASIMSLGRNAGSSIGIAVLPFLSLLRR